MKKQIIVFIVILIVGIASYLGIIRYREYQIDNFSIQLEDTSGINGIFIESANTKISLLKKKRQWMINGSYIANEIIIKRLLRIYKNLNLNILVEKDSIETYVERLKSSGIKLQFEINGKNQETYWLGEYDTGRRATLIMNSKLIPSYATAPGLSSDLTEFVKADEIFWRDKRIFGFEPWEIKSLILNDYQQSDKSFLILINKTDYQVLDVNRKNIEHSTEKVERYISYFRNISFESLADSISLEVQDSIINQTALYEIIVEFIDGNNTNLRLFRKYRKGSKNEIDLNEVYGLLNNKKPLLVISYFIIDPLLKNINYLKSEN